MALNLRFNESDWLRIQHAWAAWWAGELERPLVVLECIEPKYLLAAHYAGTFLAYLPQNMPVEKILDLFTLRLEATHYLGDAIPRFWPNFGPGAVAAFLGARVQPVPDTTWFFPPEGASMENCRVTCDVHNPWWQRVLEVTRAAVARWGGQLAVGFTDLGGNLDILASLVGTQHLLPALHDQPQQVDRLSGEVTTAWLGYYDALREIIQPTGRGITCWGPCWSPGSGYMLQSDFSYMISPAMFERFVLPDLERCCQALDYAFYHMDGKGQIPHLDRLLSLPRLRGIQWVPGEGNPRPDQWLEVLQRIRNAGKLCQVTVSPQGVITICRALGGKGFLFVVDEPQLSPRQGKAFLERLRREVKGFE